MEFILTKEEKRVCKFLYNAMNGRNGICDLTDIGEEEDKILRDLEEKGYLKNDVNCITISKDFKDFLNQTFGE
jgi:hypothetical protein